MIKETKIAIFEGKNIRRLWNDKEEKWYFSVIDVIQVLTESSIPKRYWSDLRTKLRNEGSETYEKIVRLKMKAMDGKMRLTDVSDTEVMKGSRRQQIQKLQSIEL
jgi:DNA-damage-inducible protein D